MKIYYLSPNPQLEPNNKEILEKVGKVIYFPVNHTLEKEITDKIQEADIILISPSAIQKLTNYFFNSLPNLKHLALLSSGYDWIDTKNASLHNVSISNCAGANAESVAEHTWGLILGLSKRITEHDRDLHFPNKLIRKKYEGVELKNKTLGVLGTGNVGSIVANIGKSFGMRVLGYNKHGETKTGFDEITDIKTILKESDIISIHLPLTCETLDLIDSEKLKYVKNGVIIVNTAREKIVNKDAILQELKNGKVFGYGVDAEKIEVDDAYLRFSNVVINIHNAFNTKEAKQRMENLAINNIESFIAGKPINLIKL
jgi:glycerate dehydrogenase